MRRVLYFIKRLIQRFPAVYSVFYDLLTISPVTIEQWMNRDHYLSGYGGSWVDRKDFDTVLARKKSNHLLSPQSATQMREFHEHGYIILKQAIDGSSIDHYLAEISKMQTAPKCQLKVTGVGLEEPTTYSARLDKPGSSLRIVDDYAINDTALALLLNDHTYHFLEALFETKPILTQSLKFTYGSAQPLHQDTLFVRTTAPFKLAASWIALEDVKQGSGELIFYPGSHRWNDFYFGERFTHYDEERDGVEELARWNEWVRKRILDAHAQPKSFMANKGDVLIWHAGLVHGGGNITDPKQTRHSLVGHYCPDGVRPLYHFYKPSSRKIYESRLGRYTSSYY